MCNEADVSTEQPPAAENARFPGSYEHPEWPAGLGSPPQEGSQAAVRLVRVARLERLRRRAEFKTVYARGVKAAGRFLVVFAMAGREGATRYGITVTRRVGSAVTRNRARRRVRELVRGWDGNGWQVADLVINVRRGCADARWAELEEDFIRCLTRAQRQLSGRG